jgi:hypothetical protein
MAILSDDQSWIQNVAIPVLNVEWWTKTKRYVIQNIPLKVIKKTMCIAIITSPKKNICKYYHSLLFTNECTSELS